MSHRAGHVDNSTGPGASMDRRKYLATLAVGAVAAGALLESCCTPKKKNVSMWGTLSLYDPAITSISEAAGKALPPADKRLTIPFFNSNEIEITPSQIVGFHLLKIGNPTQFVMAVNLVAKDEDDHGDHLNNENEKRELVKRNMEMDIELRELCYTATRARCAPATQSDDTQKKEEEEN